MNEPQMHIAKLDFTHSDGDGMVLVRVIYSDGKVQMVGGFGKDVALDAMAELAQAVRDEFGPFNGIRV